MCSSRRVVITGINGFIGNKIRQRLEENTWDVWGIDVKQQNTPKILVANLLSEEATKEAFAAIPSPYVIVHTAALAHGQRPPKGETCLTFNTKITLNILKACQAHVKCFVFLSSVAVYGEAGRKRPVKVYDECRPGTEYGQSKIACEKMIVSSGSRYVSILRLAPVYDADHMNDIYKRVKCPGLSRMAIRIIPEPSYSFCHVDRVVQAVLESIKEEKEGVQVYNVADQEPHRQHDLLIKNQSRITLPILVPLLSPLYYTAYLIPGKTGYKIRSLYWKLFRSNVVEV
jgi:nucleoside-diphosphate-sugar epimerase